MHNHHVYIVCAAPFEHWSLRSLGRYLPAELLGMHVLHIALCILCLFTCCVLSFQLHLDWPSSSCCDVSVLKCSGSVTAVRSKVFNLATWHYGVYWVVHGSSVTRKYSR